MSIKDIVSNALKSDPDVVRLQHPNLEPEQFYIPPLNYALQSRSNGFAGHVIRYFVAPKIGIYTPPGLNLFIRRLVPELQPTERGDFRIKDEELRCGYLLFEERIGEVAGISQRIIQLTDDSLRNLPQFQFVQEPLEARVVNPYLRHVFVYVYPSEATARDDLKDGFTEFRIPIGKLKEYQQAEVLLRK